MRKSALVILMVGLAVAPAWAQRTVDETRPLSPTGTVSVSNVEGSVTVVGWSNAEVSITGELAPDVKELSIRGDSNELSIEVEVPRHGEILETDLVIRVPAGAAVEVETVSADVELEGVHGSIDVETVSGRVKTSGRPSELSIETVSGEITVAEAAPRTDLQSVSGEINVQLAAGRLDAESVSGSIRIENGSLEEASFETVSGSITYVGDIVGRGEFDFESMSGNVTLDLPASVSAEFDVTTFSGDIDNDIGPRAQRTSKYTSEKELSFTAGSGGSDVSVSSFSGSVKIKTR